MKATLKAPAVFLVALALTLTACSRSSQGEQANRAQQAAQSVNFTENAEIENIARRLKLTSAPSAMGYIVLMNDAGQPVLYTGVKGKVTSGSKRLTDGGITGGLSDEGTYGSSSPYIFFWSTSGVYHQWSGAYLYSDKPIRLRVEPLVVDIKPQ